MLENGVAGEGVQVYKKLFQVHTKESVYHLFCCLLFFVDDICSFGENNYQLLENGAADRRVQVYIRLFQLHPLLSFVFVFVFVLVFVLVFVEVRENNY